MRKSKGRSFLGFLLTYFLTISLIAVSICLCFKSIVSEGKDAKSFIKNLELDDVAQEIVNDSVKNSSDDDTKDNSDKLVDKILTEDVVSDVTNIMVDAITEDKEVDLKDIKDSCMDAVTDMSIQTVEDVLDELKKTSNVVNIDTLKNNSIIQQYQSDFNIDVTTPIIEQMQTVYGSDSVSLDEIDIEEVKSEAKEAVKQNVIPAIEKDVDKFLEETNAEVNEQITQIKEDGDVKGFTDIIDIVLAVISKTITIGIIVAVVTVILQFVLYMRDINKPFKNIGIASILVSAIMFVIYYGVGMIISLVNEGFDGNKAIDRALNNVVNKYMGKVEGFALKLSIIYIVVAIIVIILAIIIKKKLNSKSELFTTPDTFNTNVYSGTPTMIDNTYTNATYGGSYDNNAYNNNAYSNDTYNNTYNNNSF